MIIEGTLNKLGSQNTCSKLVIIDPPYTKVSATLALTISPIINPIRGASLSLNPKP